MRTAQPQIVLGYGASDPDFADRVRIKRTSLHRDLSHVVVVPTRGSIPARVVDAWMSLAHPPNQRQTQLMIAHMEVGAAYDAAIEMILSHPELSTWRYMVTLEEDNLPHPFAMVELLDAAERGSFDVLGGLYWTKGEGGVPQIWGDRTDPINFRPQRPDPKGGIVRAWGTGMGFTAFRLDIFRKMTPPWFVTGNDAEHGLSTQDLAFYMAAERLGMRLKVGVHCGIKVGHMDENGVVW